MQLWMVIIIEEFKYENAILRISGEVNREKIEEATIIFVKKAEKCKKNKRKEKSQNGDSNTS